MAINLNIPRAMTITGLNYLERIAAFVPSDGVIVDLGAFYGSASWVLAKSSLPSVEVYAIDSWERVDWIIRRFENERGAPKFSRKIFEQNTADCENLVAIEGKSPEIVADWNKPVDMVFIDAVLGNPGFKDNLDFFEKWLKPGGVICGEGYAMRSHDVVREVDELAEKWRTKAEVIGRVWALRKPQKDQKKSESVYDIAQKPEGALVRVTTDCEFMAPYQASPLCWSGQLAKPGALRSFQLDWEEQIDGLDIVYKCAGAGTPASDIIPSGKVCKANEARVPITSIYMELVGEKARQYRLGFQAGFIKDGPGKYKDKANSKIHSDKKWLKSASKNVPISAIRVIVEKRAKG